MTLRIPEARSNSTDRLLNYIDRYIERSMIGYCDFQGIDVYIADQLFALTSFDRDGTPYFTFRSHEDDPEEAAFFQESQSQSRNEILLQERMWIKENITQESINQIQEALVIERETGCYIINSFSEYPSSAINQGFIVNLGPLLENQADTNLVSFVQRFCLTQEIRSYMMWYEENINHAL